MKTWIRNITKNEDFGLVLPMETDKLNTFINKDDEYIIIDSGFLGAGEFTSIHEINDFLLGCKENGIEMEELEVLSKVMFFHEIVEAIRNETYWLIDFDAETAHWSCGLGGDITSDFDKGMCLYDSGMFNPFRFDMTEDIYNWIDWEMVWVNANSEGWTDVTVNTHSYLVHR